MTSNQETARPNCALRYHPDGYRIDGTAIKGRQSAGAGFVKGFIEHGGTDRLVALTDSPQHFEDFRTLAGTLDRTGRAVVRAGPLDRRTLRSVGTVFLPGPGLEGEAWNRRFGSERDYSLCGVTHTIATSRVASALGRYLIAPTQPWDALVCTSAAAKEGVERILAQHADWLVRRGGGRLRCPVRLPVIPLGVDCDSYAPGTMAGARGAGHGKGRELRDRHGIAADDAVVLFVGRLSFHGKAHPTPMYMAAARAAERAGGRTMHLLLAGQFPNRATEREFREAAARFCGRARAHFLDGSAGPQGPAILAAMEAADVFVSLSDNVQETFGLTPVEAMAASLPCVVSDWNGYRDTVADGETGFLIPTVTAPPGAGIDIADRYGAGLDSYDRMIGIASLATAVDVSACAEAIARLVNDRELRARQGAAGRARGAAALRLAGGRRRIPGALERACADSGKRRRRGAAQPCRRAGEGRVSEPVRDLPGLSHRAAPLRHRRGREERRPGRGPRAAARRLAARLRRPRVPVRRRHGRTGGAAGGVRTDAGGGICSRSIRAGGPRWCERCSGSGNSSWSSSIRIRAPVDPQSHRFAPSAPAKAEGGRGNRHRTGTRR